MARHTPEANNLPYLDLLEATPGILRGLMSGLSEEDARWKPAGGSTSIAGVLARLARAEGHRFRDCAGRILAGQAAALADDGAEPPPASLDPEEDFAHFEEQRDTNLEFLRALPARAGTKAPGLTLDALLRAWAAHDLECVAEAATVIRARIASGAE